MVAVTADDIDFLLRGFSGIVARRVYEKPSAYIERVRYLDRSLSPFPGRFSYDRFPYFREIVDQFAPDCPTQQVFMMKGNQIGATTGILESVMMYYVGASPAPQLYILPDEKMARKAMELKIDPAIDNCSLRPLIRSQAKKAKGSKNTGDTALSKEYPGGYLHAVGANSGNRFRNFSYKVELVDEADGMARSIKGEGDIYRLALGRLDAYKNTSKLYIGSTPTEKRNSTIERLFERGTRKYFHIPCKFCGAFQKLEWAVWDKDDKTRQVGGIVWENDADSKPVLSTVAYKCPHCGGLMKNYDKAELMGRGKWVAENDNPDPRTESYHLTALYNPPGMYSWEDYVTEWAGCWDIKNNRVKDRDAYKVFRNLKQGLTFEDRHESITREKSVRFRRFGFARNHVPNEMAERDSGSPVLLLTCAVDVQKNGLFVDIVGWTRGGRNWRIDFRFIEGDTQSFGGPWDALADIIDNGVFCDERNGRYRIAMTLVDSGHYTDFVYSFVQRYTAGGVYACKGNDWIKDGETYKEFARTTVERIGLPVAYHINTGKLKDRISSVMNGSFWADGKIQPTWYPNFPEDFGDDYFAMYEAEEKIEEVDKETGRWLRTRWRCKFGAANHGFDTCVYNWAALEIFADDICRNVLRLPALSWQDFWDYAAADEFRYFA